MSTQFQSHHVLVDGIWLRESHPETLVLIEHLDTIDCIWANLARERISRNDVVVNCLHAGRDSANLNLSVVVFCKSQATQQDISELSRASDWKIWLQTRSLNLFVLLAERVSDFFNISVTTEDLTYKVDSDTSRLRIESTATGKDYTLGGYSEVGVVSNELHTVHEDPLPQHKEKSESHGAIYDQSKTCTVAFERTLASIGRKKDDWCASRFADFRSWAAGLGAMADGHISLDWRLREHNHVKKVILGLLEVLPSMIQVYEQETTAGPIVALTTENTPQMHLMPQNHSDSDDSLDSGAISPWSDLPDDTEGMKRSPHAKAQNPKIAAMEVIENTIEQLSRLAVAIRQSGSHWRFMKADRSLEMSMHQELTSFLKTLILITPSLYAPISRSQGVSFETMTPSSTTSMTVAQFLWEYFSQNSRLSPIQKRLIQANVVRRNRFEYLRNVFNSRHDKPPLKTTTTQTPETKVVLGPPQSRASKLPDQLPPDLKPRSQIDEPLLVIRKTLPVPPALSATDLGSNFAMPRAHKRGAATEISRQTATGSNLEYPSLPKIRDAGRKTFECPVCCQTLKIGYFTSTSAWRGHIDSDLLPYVCVFENCAQPNQLYAKKTEWINHLKQNHPRQEWICPVCFEIHENEENFKHHLSHEPQHKGAFEVEDISQIARLSLRHTFIGLAACPLCHGQPNLRIGQTILDHVAEHLHEFALYALPWTQDLHAKSDESTRLNASLPSGSENEVDSFLKEREILRRITALRYAVAESFPLIRQYPSLLLRFESEVLQCDQELEENQFWLENALLSGHRPMSTLIIASINLKLVNAEAWLIGLQDFNLSRLHSPVGSTEDTTNEEKVFMRAFESLSASLRAISRQLEWVQKPREKLSEPLLASNLRRLIRKAYFFYEAVREFEKPVRLQRSRAARVRWRWARIFVATLVAFQQVYRDARRLRLACHSNSFRTLCQKWVAAIRLPNYCQFCSIICRHVLRLESGRRDFIYHATFPAIREAAKDGCLTCAIFADDIFSHDRPLMHRDFSVQDGMNRIYQLDSTSIRWSLVYLVTAQKEFPTPRRWMLRLATVEWASRLKYPHDWPEYELCCFWESTRPEELQWTEFRLPHIERNSKSAFGLARDWMHECRSQHSMCNTFSNSPLVPSRLIDISRVSTDKAVMLVTDVAAYQSNPPFAYLSYVFGSSEILKLTKTNFNVFQRGIPVGDLPAAFQDAVLDGAEDFMIESARMPGYLRACLLLIRAAAGESPLSNFLLARQEAPVHIFADSRQLSTAPKLQSNTSKLRTVVESASTASRISSDSSSKAGRHDLTRRGAVQQVMFGQGIALRRRSKSSEETELDPLSSRGWALQEEILASRQLTYGIHEMSWLCNTCTWSESRMQAGNPSELLQHGASRRVFTHPESASSTEIFENWRIIVSHFSKLRLTLNQDKLIAISAIAATLARGLEHGYSGSLSYFAGLWEGDIVRSLLWRCPLPGGPRGTTCPTWSWASVPGPVDFDLLGKTVNNGQVIARIRKITVNCDAGNPYGSVDGGKLELRGPLFPCTGFNNYDFNFYWDVLDEFPNEKRSSAFFIPLLTWELNEWQEALTGLVIAPLKGDWQRVGMMLPILAVADEHGMEPVNKRMHALREEMKDQRQYRDVRIY